MYLAILRMCVGPRTLDSYVLPLTNPKNFGCLTSIRCEPLRPASTSLLSRIQLRESHVEEMYRVKGGCGGHVELPCPLLVGFSQHLDVFNLETLKILLFGTLWRFTYIGIIDKSLTNGNWLNLQPLAPLPTRRLGMGLRVPSFQWSLGLSSD